MWKTEKWSEISVVSIPFRAWSFKLLVNILSISVAVVSVTLVGLLMTGINEDEKIKLINLAVGA